MPLVLDHLRSGGGIYEEGIDTLANRIDFAWSIYTSNKRGYETYRKEALKFLIYAFDINSPEDINLQLLTLMDERNKHKSTNPEYIPGKSPQNIPFDPSKLRLPLSVQPYKSTDPKIHEAMKKQELLDVNEESKEIDVKFSVMYLTPIERAARRIIINNGSFKKNGKLFDTSTMISHKKLEFAAVTLNANGELSLFNHHEGEIGSELIAHSSMNAGSPVVFAGEIKIKNGVLKAITTHSGHYQPSLFNVYRLLEYFSKHGVDISKAHVYTFNNPKTLFPILSSRIEYFTPSDSRSFYLFKTPALQIFNQVDNILNQNISTIKKQVNSYRQFGLVNMTYRIKDAITGSDLTQQRIKLATDFERVINTFKKGMTRKLEAKQLGEKIVELDKIIKEYEQKNKDLSIKYGKKDSSGRLTKRITHFKEKLELLKKQQSSEDIEQPDPSSMKKLF